MANGCEFACDLTPGEEATPLQFTNKAEYLLNYSFLGALRSYRYEAYGQRRLQRLIVWIKAISTEIIIVRRNECWSIVNRLRFAFLGKRQRLSTERLAEKNVSL